jgi:DNA polymerase
MTSAACGGGSTYLTPSPPQKEQSMTEYIGLDFETYSGTDIKRHGLDRYISDPDFTPLIASVYSGSGGAATFDFIFGGEASRSAFLSYIQQEIDAGFKFSCHNVGFERAVLRWMGVDEQTLLEGFVDSAVIARCQGAASKLEAAAPQLVGMDKLESGLALIKLFSVPNEWNGHAPPTAELIWDTDRMVEWEQFIEYCGVDAQGSYLLAERYPATRVHSTQVEEQYEQLTAAMNQHGWKVDLELVHEMQLRYQQNVEQEVARFRAMHDPKGELNFGSPAQLKKWCAERGVRATSFDTEHVEKLLATLDKKLGTLQPSAQFESYSEVREMLRTKQILGGSSLTKLQTIIDTVGVDGRLRNQYMHVGAGQSFRTSGRGVQLQNLKRLGSDVMDTDLLYQEDYEADNDTLAENLRQVFTASHEDGELIIGDFSSVESRGLAWLAGADWKIEAFRRGQDMYKVLASKIYNVEYGMVDKVQRQTGKVGELSCGYGAGSGAVVNFAKGMGVEMTEVEAKQLVDNWRATNPEIVTLWDALDSALKRSLTLIDNAWVQIRHDLYVTFERIITPQSLTDLHPGAQSIKMILSHHGGGRRPVILERVFHGMYLRGRNVCYYKPSERKSGPLWVSHFKDPKTKQVRYYDVYGGKLAGILTQSFCRELFFTSLSELFAQLASVPNAAIVGQFHDEIGVDWVPDEAGLSLEETMKRMETAMTYVDPMFDGFPLEADIKHAYRYIK